MDRLNNAAQVVTKYLTKEGLVDLRRERPTSQSLTDLTLDRRKRRFDIGSFVIVLQKLRTVKRVESDTCATIVPIAL